MTRRAAELLALTLVGGATAAYLAPANPWPGVLGAGAGGLAWLVLDNGRARRVLAWLRQGYPARPPHPASVWGEVVQRTRKSLKALDRKAKKSETRLNEFLAAIQASPNGVVLLNKNSAIEWCNETAAAHLGFDPQRDLLQYITNLVRDPVFTGYLKAGDFRQPVEIEGRQTQGPHPQRVSIQIHPYAKGRRLMLTRDVTALQLAEAMRRDFVANVSHEIRTPLTVLSGFVETMIHLDLSPEERHRYLALMNQQAQRMQTLVIDLLTLSRLDDGSNLGPSEWIPAHDLLLQVVQEARSLSDLLVQGHHVVEARPCPPFQIAGTRSELHSALSNLMNNAVRYTPAGGRIDAGWQFLADGGVEFCVTDTGPGIAPEHLPRLTERFYRVDRSRSRETGGTGLGLAIVKHAVQRHGGTLHIQSTLGQGSTFRIVLPASRVLREPNGAASRL